MENMIKIPHDWGIIGVQRPLFIEHTHTVVVRDVRLVQPKRVRVKWRCTGGGALAGREFVETFNLARRKGKEKFKDFLFALPIEPEGRQVDLETCLGRSIVVMAVSRQIGRATRIEIIHHLL